MRIIGACMVILGCLGFAWQLIERDRKRIAFLEQWRDILEYMEGDVGFGKTTLLECFLRVGMQYDSKLGQCIGRAGRNLENAPQKNMQSELLRLVMEEFGDLFLQEEYQELFRLTYAMGFQKEEMQLRVLARNRENVEERLAIKKGIYHGKRRAYLCLGTMTGVVLVLLLI